MGLFNRNMICPNCNQRALPYNGVCGNCGYDAYVGITSHGSSSNDEMPSHQSHDEPTQYDLSEFKRIRFDTRSLNTSTEIARFVRQLRTQRYSDDEIREGFSHSSIDIDRYL